MPEVIALPKHRFALVAGQGVAEAIPEVEVGRMAAALAVIAISLSRNLRLFSGYGFNPDVETFNQFIQLPTELRVFPPIHHYGSLQVVRGRDSSGFSGIQRLRKAGPFRLPLENCDQCG